ncbi:hypothetical protein [Mycolicibacterium frederiksbergense]|uniref:hypothetical protein n=1 Tax=Mycolicibacterium frederiksbergense TaxID=117567 RepID=UPI002473BC3D|nr:hypothetical protein [Mycolicibacterium frederiksbergense]
MGVYRNVIRAHRPAHPTGRCITPGRSIRNVHERWLPADPTTVWELLQQLGTGDDVVWPARNWAPITLNGPLQVGVSAGHGAVRYHCTALIPRRLIEFTFDSVAGRHLDGHHAFELFDRAGGTLLRHTIDAEVLNRFAVLNFRLFIQPTHDVVTEELLTNVERLVGGSMRRLPRWSPWVRYLRHRRGLPIRPTP